MFTIQDWRQSPASLVGEALNAEAARWRSDFAWDVTDAWRSIEPARVAGRLPGFMAVDDAGRIVGWTCFLLHQSTLQVAVLSAHSSDVTEALVDAILSSPDASAAEAYAVCVRDHAPMLAETLAQYGFDNATYRYLTAGTRQRVVLTGGLPPAPTRQARPLLIEDLDGLVRLFACAYAEPEVRAFAPLGTEAEWYDYAAGLFTGPGCGLFVPSASLVIDGPNPGCLHAAVVATDLGCGTGHIAQLASDPDARGLGFATALVERAIEALAAGGFSLVSLLVSTRNEAALRLYKKFGFRNRAAFAVAVNRQPRRLSSVALATGGASTRR